MKLSARTFLYGLIAMLVVFILFHLIVPVTMRDGFTPMEDAGSLAGVGDASGLVTSGEVSTSKHAKQPAGLSADAISRA